MTLSDATERTRKQILHMMTPRFSNDIASTRRNMRPVVDRAQHGRDRTRQNFEMNVQHGVAHGGSSCCVRAVLASGRHAGRARHLLHRSGRRVARHGPLPLSNGRSIDEFVPAPKTPEGIVKRQAEGLNTVDWYFTTKKLRWRLVGGFPHRRRIMGGLNESDRQALLEALDDEHRAWATYDQVLADFGDVRPFSNIREAEARHIQALQGLFERYGLVVPANPWPGKVERYSSLRAACAAAVASEIANGEMYQRLLGQTWRDDILAVLRNLQAASQERHLPAFRRCAQRGPGGGPGPGGQRVRARGRA